MHSKAQALTDRAVVGAVRDHLRRTLRPEGRSLLHLCASAAIWEADAREPAPHEQELLVDALAREIPKVDSIFADPRCLEAEGDVRRMDLALARLLRAYGKAGEEEAKGYLHETERALELLAVHSDVFASSEEEEKADPWWPWRIRESGETAFLNVLALALWRGEVRRSTKYPALSATVLSSVMGAYFFKGRSPDVEERRLLNKAREPVAMFESAPWLQDPTELMKHISAGGSVASHRFFRWLVHEAAARVRDRQPNPSRIQIEGGLNALAAALGLRSNSAPDSLRRVLETFQHVHITLPYGEVGGLLTWALKRPAPGQASVLTMNLSDALLPNYVDGLPNHTRSQRASKRLVPVPRLLPPLLGHERDYSAQATLQLSVLAEFRRRADELVAPGYLVFTQHRWNELAGEAGVRESLREDLFDLWVSGGEDAPPMLALVLPDREEDGPAVTLAEAYRSEWVLLLGAGRLVRKGRRGGLARARGKAARWWKRRT